MKLNPSTILLVLLLLVSFIGAGGLWYGSDILQTWKEKETTLRQEIADEAGRSLRLNALKSAFERAQSEKEDLDTFFYQNTEEEWLRFATEMDRLRRNAGIKSETNVAEFSGKEEPFREEVKFSGEWNDIYRYFTLLETFPARVVIKNFSLQADGTSRDLKDTTKWQGAVSLELASIKYTK